MNRIFHLVLLMLACSTISCERKTCFDESLTHNNACTADCPGVCGCDGQTYCNECEAHRNGIPVLYNSPCD